MVGLAVVEVGVAHAQHLVGQQGRVEGNVAKLRVISEFAGIELAGAHPLEVHVLGQALRALQEVVNAEVGAGRGPGPNQGSKLGVGVVAGRSLGGGGAIGNVLLLVEAQGLAQISQRHHIAQVFRGAVVVGHIHLHAGNRHATLDGGQVAQGLVIPVAEKLRQEKVPVPLVLADFYFVLSALGPVLNPHLVGGAAYSSRHSRHAQLTKLELRFHPKQVLATLHQRVGERQAHVAQIDLADDVGRLAHVVELHLVIEVERGFGIVVEHQFEFGANLSGQVQVDVLLEQEVAHALLAQGQGRVFILIEPRPQLDADRAGRSDIDVAAPKNAIGNGTQVNLRNQALGLGCAGRRRRARDTTLGLLTVVVADGLALLKLLILLVAEHAWVTVVDIAPYFFLHIELLKAVVHRHVQLYVLGQRQNQWRLATLSSKRAAGPVAALHPRAAAGFVGTSGIYHRTARLGSVDGQHAAGA